MSVSEARATVEINRETEVDLEEVYCAKCKDWVLIDEMTADEDDNTLLCPICKKPLLRFYSDDY